jgi:histidine phosphotransferase ChpT
MITGFSVRQLEAQLALAGLLCSRICHDLVSPVGAIGNGIEVLAEENDPGMRQQAIALIADSAERASHKLQYLRLALGATGGAGARLAMDEAGAVARAWFGHGRHTLDWQVAMVDADRRVGRLLLCLILVAEESLPRGGRIAAAMSEDGTGVTILLTMNGTGARLPPEWDVDAVLADGFDALSPRGAQVCYAAMLARALGARIQSRVAEDQIEIVAHVAAEA